MWFGWKMVNPEAKAKGTGREKDKHKTKAQRGDVTRSRSH